MKVARFELTLDLLREVLHLPTGAEILHVGMSARPFTAIVTVEHDGLKDVALAEDQLPPLVCPAFRKNVPVEFLEWGQK